MADEEKQDQQEQPADEQTEAPAEQAEAPAESAEPAEPKAAKKQPADDGAEAPAEEEEEGKPSPRQLRKKQRSTFEGQPAPSRSPQERAEQRRQHRKQRANARSRWRAKRREKKRASASAPAAPTVAAQPEPGTRKARQGVVVSNKAEKTITVRIDNVRQHRTYGKVVRDTTTLHAHDERNEAGEGDVVRVIECRPLSRSKRWRLEQILERAK